MAKDNSTQKGRRRKGRKRPEHILALLPYPDYPLSPHPASGRWYKKIRGTRHYFGPLNDPDGALAEYQRVRDDLYAGREPGPAEGGLTIRHLCNDFLTAKQHLRDTGEITPRTFNEYRMTCDAIVAAFGKTRLVDDLTAGDFRKLRGHLAKGRALVTLRNHIQRARSVFIHAFEAGLTDRTVRFGKDFTMPARRNVRREQQGKPRKYFTAAEVRAMLDHAKGPIRVMILLGINCGLGNMDCSELPIDAMDLDKGILDFTRPKTGVERRAILWPETIAALKAVLAKRKPPKDTADAGLLFITKMGHRFVRDRVQDNGHTVRVDGVAQEFAKVMKAAGIKANGARKGVGFYSLRHTCETVGGQALDQAALDRIMGHEHADMASHYRKWLRDDAENARLRKVADHVHNWLFEVE